MSPGKRASQRHCSSGAGFAAVAADESRAAEVGRDVLQAGGNATDAAVAMYFAMAVTLPSAASLGASGVCIVHDDKTRAGEAFVFPPVAAPGAVGGHPFTVPTGVRAITLMHVRHGQARWEPTVAPAERLARLGVPVSRALSRDLQAGGGAARRRSRGAAHLRQGQRHDGDRRRQLTQTDLAATLGVIRQRGGVDFFQGALARPCRSRSRRWAAACRSRRCAPPFPQAGPPAGESYGGVASMSRRRRLAGAMALAGWKGQAPGGAAPTDSGGFAGLAAIDGKGGAAACSLSMGQLFGARVIVPGPGILLGAPTADAGSVSPLVIGNPGNGEILLRRRRRRRADGRLRDRRRRARHGRGRAVPRQRAGGACAGRAATSTPSPARRACAAAARPATAASIRPAPAWR